MGKSRNTDKYGKYWKPTNNKPKKNKQRNSSDQWKPMGGSAQSFLNGDDSAFHD